MNNIPEQYRSELKNDSGSNCCDAPLRNGFCTDCGDHAVAYIAPEERLEE